jgi:hypothetical protein
VLLCSSGPLDDVDMKHTKTNQKFGQHILLFCATVNTFHKMGVFFSLEELKIEHLHTYLIEE